MRNRHLAAAMLAMAMMPPSAQRHMERQLGHLPPEPERQPDTTPEGDAERLSKAAAKRQRRANRRAKEAAHADA